MKVLYQIPSPETVYAARFIFEGYKRAFTDLGHEFRALTSNDSLKDVLEEFSPDIFVSSLNRYLLKFLDLELLKKHRERGLVYFNQIRPWQRQGDQFEGSGLKDDKFLLDLIDKGLAGDVFFHCIEQDDPSMDGFAQRTGYQFHTILLAADKSRFYYEYDPKFKSDISFVGSLLPDKKEFMKTHVMPLMKKYNVQVYGSDWTIGDQIAGYVQKFGQYFNIEQLKHVRDLKLSLEDEHKVYSSSTISLNVHESHQRRFGSDFNERTLKIMASGGFEICDNVAVLRRYFSDKELVIGENTKDWFEKIDYFLKNSEKREPIINAGQKKVLENHTYHNRVNQIIDIYKSYKGQKQ